MRGVLQELRELGVGGSLYRLGWELRMRSGLMVLLDPVSKPDDPSPVGPSPEELRERVPFASPRAMQPALETILSPESRKRLNIIAREATSGRVKLFGRQSIRLREPIDWHRQPFSGEVWPRDRHWSRVLTRASNIGDVRLVWEVGRFPQAYHLARAAIVDPNDASDYANALAEQILMFYRGNPRGRGVHWASSQEVAFRMMAWLFGYANLLHDSEWSEPIAKIVSDACYDAGVHIERHIDYSRRAVYNNHLLSEAVGLLVASTLLPGPSFSARWRTLALEILDEECEHQFYSDGGYIQQSHNYHRVAIQVLLWAALFLRGGPSKVRERIVNALDRSVEFLAAHQNGQDGRLPNYGPNDGSLPAILSTCDFSDFRPTLQAASILARGSRLYDRGAWDEEPAWLLGPECLDAPLQAPRRKSVSFARTGSHVLRDDSGSFAQFRCGSMRDRFGQIDMLHLDVWWRGENVLVDPGSYMYAGSEKWHNHFTRTKSHNTVVVDGQDQMVHYRRFKFLYPTRARLINFSDGNTARCSGEHYGYHRLEGDCVHRRSVLFAKPDLWVVVDQVEGFGNHTVRLQWLGGPYPFEFDGGGLMSLETPAGSFTVAVFDRCGSPMEATVVAGQEDPPRGWVSRYYGEKIAAPSLVMKAKSDLPLALVSVLSAGVSKVEVTEDRWLVAAANRRVAFRLVERADPIPIES